MLDSRPRTKMAASALRALLGARLVCGVMLELQTRAELERSLVGLARYPLTARRMAGPAKNASRVLVAWRCPGEL